MRQALHIQIWQLSTILLLVLSFVWLDGGRCTFSGFSRNIWLGSSTGSGWATQGHAQSCLKATLAVCLGSLSCWKVNILCSLRFWMLWSGFSSSQYFGALGFYSTLCASVPATDKLPHSIRLQPAHFTLGMVLCRAGSLQTWSLELRFIRPDNIIYHCLRVL